MATNKTATGGSVAKSEEAQKAIVVRSLAPMLMGLAERQHELASMPKPATIRRELAAQFLSNVDALALALDTMEAKLRGGKQTSDKVICALEAVNLCRRALADVRSKSDSERMYAMQVMRGHMSTLAAWFTATGSTSRDARGEYKPDDNEKAFLRIAKSLMGQATRLEPATLSQAQWGAITADREEREAKRASKALANVVDADMPAIAAPVK